MHPSHNRSLLKRGTVVGMAALGLCVPHAASAQSLEVKIQANANDPAHDINPVTVANYDTTDTTPVSDSHAESYAFLGGVGSANYTNSATADYGTLHTVAYTDLSSAAYNLSAASASTATFNDTVYLAPTAEYAAGTLISLSARMDITASVTTVGPPHYASAYSSYSSTFGATGNNSISVYDDQFSYDDIGLSGNPTGTFQAYVGDTLHLSGRIQASIVDAGGNFPAYTQGSSDVSAKFYLSAPGVSLIGTSDHNYAAPLAVPEASNTAILTAFGLFGVWTACRVRKSYKAEQHATKRGAV